MTDEELIAEDRRVARELLAMPVLGRHGDLVRLAAGLLKEAADRLEGRAAAQATEDNHG